MTVSYTAEVATSTNFGCFLKLLARWRASVYKVIWIDLLLFLGMYYALSLLYRFALDDKQKYIFESVVSYCNEHLSLIPLSFVLGFYVSVVVERWWDQYISIPWPDPVAVVVSALVRGQDERGRVMRRSIMRYVCLSLTMMLTMTSPAVKKRYPTLDHLIDAGLLVESEKQILVDMNEKFPKHPNHWMPIVWAASIATRARKEGRIWDDFSLRTIIDELNNFRGKCGNLLHYDWISVPLVYTQVVTLAVYTYFLGAVFGNQWVEKQDADGFMNQVDHYFPVFAALQFCFYIGWLKVAECLINPFGDDDDDFEMNSMLDRNLLVSYLIVDDMHHEHPVLVRDQYWDNVFPPDLPYPEDADILREQHPTPSTAKLDMKASIAQPTFSAARIDDMQSQNIRRRRSMRIMASLQDNWSRLNASFIHYFNRNGNQTSRMRLSSHSSSSRTSETEGDISTIIFRGFNTERNARPDQELQLAEDAPKNNEFEQLKEERERGRLVRQRQVLMRSVGQTPHGTPSQPASAVQSRADVPRNIEAKTDDEQKDE